MAAPLRGPHGTLSRNHHPKSLEDFCSKGITHAAGFVGAMPAGLSAKHPLPLSKQRHELVGVTTCGGPSLAQNSLKLLYATFTFGTTKGFHIISAADVKAASALSREELWGRAFLLAKAHWAAICFCKKEHICPLRAADLALSQRRDASPLHDRLCSQRDPRQRLGLFSEKQKWAESGNPGCRNQTLQTVSGNHFRD